MATKELKFKLTADTNLLKSQLEKAMEGPAKMLQKAVGGVGGRVGNAISSFPVGGAVGAGLSIAGSVVGLLKIISDRISEMVTQMRQASASYDAAKQMQEKIFNLALKPMGDVMTQLMKPYLMIMMRQTREAMKQIQPFLKGAAKGNQSDIDAITQIIQNNLYNISRTMGNMEDIVKPIASRIAGFKDATDLIFQRWLTGTKEYVEGFLAAMDKQNISWSMAMVDPLSRIVASAVDIANWFNGETKRVTSLGTAVSASFKPNFQSRTGENYYIDPSGHYFKTT